MNGCTQNSVNMDMEPDPVSKDQIEAEVGKEDSEDSQMDKSQMDNSEGKIPENGEVEDKEIDVDSDLDISFLGVNNALEPGLNDLIKEFSLYSIQVLKESEAYLYFFGKGNEDILFRTDKELDNALLLYKEVEENNHDNYQMKVIENSDRYNQTVVCILNEDFYEIYDEHMELIEEVILPKEMRRYINRTDFRNWDINESFDLIVFTCDDIGLELYDLNSNEIKHIADNNIVEWDDSASEVNGIAVFIMNDQYISSKCFGYEWTSGYNLYNIEKETLTSLKGAYAQSLSGSKGLYCYFDDGHKATLFDFEKDQRIARGVRGGFADDGFNALVEDKVIIGKYDYENDQYVIDVEYLRLSESARITVIQSNQPGIDLHDIRYLYANENKLYLFVLDVNRDLQLVSIDISQYMDNISLMTVNNQVLVNGSSDLTGESMDFGKLEGKEMNLYEARKGIGTYPMKIMESFYEGEYEVVYEDLRLPEEDLVLGVPAEREITFYTPIETDEISIVEPYIKDILVEYGIENMTYTITQMYRLPEWGNQILVHVRDDQRDNVGVKLDYTSWQQEDYQSAKKGFFYLDMLIDPGESYANVISSGVWRFTPNLGFPMFEIVEMGEFDEVEGLDVLYKVQNYDYFVYSLIKNILIK